jgi:4-hydroxy-tetrahydrodipicolinate synthase
VQEAMKIQNRLVPLHDAMFAESNPGPVKYALSRLGFGANVVRLPLVTVSMPTKIKIDAAMREVGLLN